MIPSGQRGAAAPLRVLVTGCAGFIGWKVTELLLRDGHTVVGVDNLNGAYDPRLKQWCLRQLEPLTKCLRDKLSKRTELLH